MYLLQCNELSININQNTILKNINLVLEKNISYTILGRSGSGKTSLLNAISGLLPIHSGSISYHGEKLTKVNKNISYVFQKDNLLPWKTVEDNLLLCMLNQNIPKEDKHSKIDSMLKELDMIQHKKKYPAHLSEGERQRIAIAKALITQPELLLMDEPTSALDAFAKENFQQIILNMIQQHPITFVMVTHDIEEAVFLGQKILILSKGKITKHLDNPLFQKSNKNSIEFYQSCINLRKYLFTEDWDE